MKYSNVIVCVHDKDELNKLANIAKYINKGDVEISMKSKMRQSLDKKPVEMDESVYILFTADGRHAETSTEYFYKDTYPLIPITEDMWIKDHSVKSKRIKDEDVLWIHHGNKKPYKVIDTCSIQIDDNWVEAVIYVAEDSPAKYVRSVTEFVSKFEQYVGEDEIIDCGILNELFITKAKENDSDHPFLSTDDILIIKSTVPEEDDCSIVMIHKWLKENNIDVTIYRDLEKYLEEEYNSLPNPSLDTIAPICQNVMNNLSPHEQVIVGTMCYKGLDNSKDISKSIRREPKSTAATISVLIKKGVIRRNDGNLLVVSSILRDWFKSTCNRRKTDKKD